MVKAIEQQRTLSVRQVTQKKRQTKLVITSFMIIGQLASLVVAIDICIFIYWYLAPWPVYRIVSFIVVFILWSNSASVIIRISTKKQAKSLLHTISTRVVKKPLLNEDTTTYLVALKSEAIKGHYANIETRRVQRVVPSHNHDHRLVHRTQITSTR